MEDVHGSGHWKFATQRGIAGEGKKCEGDPPMLSNFEQKSLLHAYKITLLSDLREIVGQGE